jgi:putative glutamine amidotransferase
VTAPRIAVSGVVRTWDGADRTGVNAAYVRAVLLAGGVPLLLSPLMGTTMVARALEGVDGLLLTGGEDMDPAWYGSEPSPQLDPPSRDRDLFELALFAVARHQEMPILGICRGIQLINVAMGGTLFQDLPTERPGAVEHRSPGRRDLRSHAVRLLPGSRVAQALGAEALRVNSSHHQGIRTLAPGLTASGWTEDQLVEAVESPAEAPWLMAVQWHPEEMHADPRALEHGLFRALVNVAGNDRSGLVRERRKEETVTHAVQRTP